MDGLVRPRTCETRSQGIFPVKNGQNDSISEVPGKRQAILDEAIRTFTEVGFRRADVQVIADRAGVGKGTVYRYFRSKEELFWATTFVVLDKLDQQIITAIEREVGACAKLRAAAVAHAAFFETNPQYINLMVQERAEFCGSIPEEHHLRHEKMFDMVGEILEQGMKSGELLPLNPRQTTLAIGCLLFGTSMLSGHIESVNLMKMTGYAIDIFLRGIRNGKGEGRHFPASDMDTVSRDKSEQTELSCLTETHQS